MILRLLIVPFCFVSMNKDKTMLIDEFIFRGWEFVGGELFSFWCVRVLESVTFRDKMSFLQHGEYYSMTRQSCECEFNTMSIYSCSEQRNM